MPPLVTMRVRVLRTCLLALAAAALLVMAWRWRVVHTSAPGATSTSEAAPVIAAPTAVTLCAVCCGDERVHETLTMLKSAVVLSRLPLRAIVLADEVARPALEEKLGEWRAALGEHRLRYDVRPLRFPAARADEWRRLFKPCAAQRLFLPDVLPDVDALLYVDTDVLFVDGPERTWRHFGRMNSTQMAALAPEHHDPNVGWYNRYKVFSEKFTIHPLTLPFTEFPLQKNV